MSQIQEFEPQQFGKMWQALDYCVRTGKYKQTSGELWSGDNRRCVLGALMSLGGFPDSKLPSSHTTEAITFVEDRYHVHSCRDLPCVLEQVDYTRVEDKATAVAMTYDHIRNAGHIHLGALVTLNDRYHVTFEEFRDLLRELDI